MNDKYKVIHKKVLDMILEEFQNEKLTYKFSYDKGVDMLFAVLNYSSSNSEINTSKEIINSIESFCSENIKVNELANIRTNLVINLESYIKKIYKIIQGVTPNGELASILKQFFSKKNIMSKPLTNKFFDKDAKTKKPKYSDKYFREKVKLGFHLKKVYDLRNKKTHNDESSNFIEIGEQIRSIFIVYSYITFEYYEELINKEIGISNDNNNFKTNWSIFLSELMNFNKNYNYILITDSLNCENSKLKYLGKANWDFVFDFDKDSEDNGLLSLVKSSIQKKKAVNEIIYDPLKKYNFQDNTLDWFFAKGIVTSSSSLPDTDNFFSWKKKYSAYIRNMMLEYHKKHGMKPLIVLVLAKADKYLEEIIYSISDSFSNDVKYIFNNNVKSDGDLNDLLEVQNSNFYIADFNIEELLEGFRQLVTSKNDAIEEDFIYLPCNSMKGKSTELEAREYQLVKRYFEVLDLNIEKREGDKEDSKSFYQGRIITWKELMLDYDIKRELSSDVEEEVLKWLSNRSTGIVNLYHAPGAGGTTIGRRICFNLYKKYPTVILKDYDKTQTVEEIHRIFDLTGLPVFVLVDNGVITTSQINELCDTCEIRSIKVTFLFIQRTFDECNNKLYLPLTLYGDEQYRFKEKFKEKFPEKSENFDKIYANGNSKELTPFYLGLIAYEKEYMSLEEYVSVRIKNITEGQKEVIKFIAFSSYYSKGEHGLISSKILNKLLNINSNILILQNNINNKKIFDLIVEEEPLKWRTLHYLIAEEILKQTIGINNKGNLIPEKLKDMSIKFIDTLRKTLEYSNNEILDILRSIFIYRYYKESGAEISFDENGVSDEELGGAISSDAFSKVIMDLDNNEIRIEILKTLVEKFPSEEPHFYAHLARMYSYDHRYKDAINTIDDGLSCLKSIDSRRDYFILFHIKGMCLRAKAYEIKDKFHGDKECPSEKIEEFKALFEEAESEFSEVRKLAPNKEHGYISYIQFTCQAIEFGFSISNKNKKAGYTQFLTNPQNEWFREKLYNANELLNKIKEKSSYCDYSKYVKRQNNNLLKYYDEHTKLIESWYKLLNDPNFDKLQTRRYIVYAYLAKNKFDLNFVNKHELSKIHELLDENLKTNPDDKDIRMWFNIARKININIESIIRNLKQWEFLKECQDTVFYLFALYVIKALNQDEGTDEYIKKYMKESRERNNGTTSKIFCPEWLGRDKTGKLVLINYRDVGEWDRQKNFFKDENPKDLFKMKGKVKRIEDRTKGFIQLDGCDVEAFYVPGIASHYTSNERDNVNFYIGFNYYGVRAFKVESIE